MSLGKEELDIFSKLSPAFKVVFDVGSRDDIDYFEIKKDCEYHLFEPNLKAIASLKKKISELGSHRIILNEFGLSDKNKDDCVYYSNVQSFIPHWNTASFDTGERFSLRKLDDYVDSQEISFIDFLKIDVEGMDYQVILGGTNTIKNKNKISFIQIECSGGCRQYVELLSNFTFYLMMEPKLLELINTINDTKTDFNKSLVKLDDWVINLLDKKLSKTGGVANILGVNKNIDFSSMIQEKYLVSNVIDKNKPYGKCMRLYFAGLYLIKGWYRQIRKTIKTFLFA